jgi:hypothetical protein
MKYSNRLPLHLGYFVYRLSNAGRNCIYTGMTDCVPGRIGQHIRTQTRHREVHRFGIAECNTRKESSPRGDRPDQALIILNEEGAPAVRRA